MKFSCESQQMPCRERLHGEKLVARCIVLAVEQLFGGAHSAEPMRRFGHRNTVAQASRLWTPGGTPVPRIATRPTVAALWARALCSSSRFDQFAGAGGQQFFGNLFAQAGRVAGIARE